MFKVTNGLLLQTVGENMENFHFTEKYYDFTYTLPSWYFSVLSQQWQIPEKCVKYVKR